MTYGYSSSCSLKLGYDPDDDLDVDEEFDSFLTTKR